MDKALVLFILMVSTVVETKTDLLTALIPVPVLVPTHKMLEFSAELSVRMTK